MRQYSADEGGSLSELTPPSVATGLTPTAAAASPDRRSLYVVNQSSRTVSQYDIGADGTLTVKTPESVDTGRSPVAVAVAPDGQHVYVVNQGDRTVSTYAVDAAGALTFVSNADTGEGPLQIAVSPNGASAYVTNFTSGSVSQYNVTATGELETKVAPPVLAAAAAGIAVSPDSASVYVTNQSPNGTVSQFSADPESGALSPQAADTVAAGVSPRAIVAAPGRVYVANVGSDSVSQYAADGAGALSPLAPATVPTDTNPFALTLSPDGRSVYVALFTDPVIDQYDVASDGTLAAKAEASVPASARQQSVVAVQPRDEQAPTVDLRTPPEGAQYALAEDVRADYSCADEGGSGLESCTGDVPDGDPLDTSTAGPHSFTVVARDGAGHETTVTHSYTVAPDGQAPTVDLRTPPEGAQYDLGAHVKADYSCADEGGSGLQSCTGDVPDGDPLDTSTAGLHNFTVVARDGAGSETTVAHSYTVVEPLPPPPSPDLGFAGFVGSIRNGSVVRAGDAIPIVFALDSYQGLDILADGSPSSVQVDCRYPGQATGGEPARSASDRGLRFNPRTGHYVFTWQTRSSWAGTCRTFILGLRDGTVARLTVSFRSAWHWRH